MNKNRNTLFIGSHLFHFPSLSSTNDYAIQMVAKTRPAEGTVISTYHQTQGHGQYGSKWESEAASHLAFTTILYPRKVPPRDHFYLNKAVSLAVTDLIAANHTDLVPQIKWPNDILLKGRKASGILIQNTLSASLIQQSIIGIGLNVNQAGFPAHLPLATSLFREAKQTFNLDTLREDLCFFLEKRYLELLNGHLDRLEEHYLQRLFRLGEWTSFREPDGPVWEGVVRGTTRDGMLEVEDRNGRIKVFQTKEIQWVLSN